MSNELNVICEDDKTVPSAFLEAGAVRFERDERIRLTSGIYSPGIYTDCRKLPTHPEVWDRVLAPAENFLRVFSQKAGRKVVIAGVASGAIPHTSAIARALKIPYVSVQKEAKARGIADRVVGDREVLVGTSVVVLEDVGTTGGSAFEAVHVLRRCGARVEDVIFLMTYGFQELLEGGEEHEVNLHTVCTFDMIFAEAIRTGKVRDTSYQERIRSWLKNPR